MTEGGYFVRLRVPKGKRGASWYLDACHKDVPELAKYSTPSEVIIGLSTSVPGYSATYKATVEQYAGNIFISLSCRILMGPNFDRTKQIFGSEKARGRVWSGDASCFGPKPFVYYVVNWRFSAEINEE